MREKDNFLDRSSLFAIALLGLSWISWDIYMKKKYPRRAAAPPASQEEASKAPPPPQDSAAAAARPLKKEQSAPPPEKLFFYSGKEADISLSSRGMGVRELRLKGFFDSKGESIVFRGQAAPLFASFFLRDGPAAGGRPIPFEVQETGPGAWRGVHRSNGAEIIKTAELDGFALKTKISVKRAGSFPAGLSLSFSRPLPAKPDMPWLLKPLFLYGRDVFKGFALSDGRAERFFGEELPEHGARSHSRLSAAAGGGKFFGAAFVSRSRILPSGTFKNKAGRIFFRADYEFLSPRPAALEYTAFLGPKSLDSLQPLGAEGWLDFGFFGWLAMPLLRLLKALFGQTQNWGLAIALLTLLVRLCLFPINLKAYKSMKAMQKLQPQLQKLREKHKEDPQKLNREWLALLKSSGASPFGGCLPLFFQLPVFVALYRVLGESAELYQAPLGLWIQDLSQKDPFYALPALSGLAFFVQQKISPSGLPKAQARLLAMAPLVFTVFMLSLPSGLTLYLFVSGLFGLAQQAFFLRARGAEAAPAAAKAPPKKPG